VFDRSEGGNRAILVCPREGRLVDAAEQQEFTELARSAGAEVLDVLTTTRKTPDARFYIGSGKAEELAARISELEADLVLVDAPLSPIQERNLEKVLQCRVLDRTGLILDIFSQRARSHEGKLQVELAQLRHLSTRLVRGWTHLERQKGGIGLRGPGETQLETDRRLLAVRVKSLRKRLQGVLRQREQGRRQRQRRGTGSVALVGYTNAGKSTLFNRLTDAGVYQADQLFATLDPTVRQLPGIQGKELVISDTVGFVRDLPHELVAAFRATLQETRDADLLIHVIDHSDPDRLEHIQRVKAVLREIGADSIPTLEVMNKIDLTGHPAGVLENVENELPRVFLSAHSGEGTEDLLAVIEKHFTGENRTLDLTVPGQLGKLRARFFALDAVRDDRLDDKGRWRMRVELPLGKWQQLATGESAEARWLQQQLNEHLAESLSHNPQDAPFATPLPKDKTEHTLEKPHGLE
jgi:GTP-binding protein HflX